MIFYRLKGCHLIFVKSLCSFQTYTISDINNFYLRKNVFFKTLFLKILSEINIFAHPVPKVTAEKYLKIENVDKLKYNYLINLNSKTITKKRCLSGINARDL
jgi:hypothetical protein